MATQHETQKPAQRGRLATAVKAHRGGIMATAILVGVFMAFLAALAALGTNPVAALMNASVWIMGMFVAAGGIWVAIVIAVAALTLLFRWDNKRYNRGSGEQNAKMWALVVVASIVCVCSLVMGVRTANRYGHDVKNSAVNAVLEVKEGDGPAYVERTPFVVAKTLMQRALGDTGGLSVPDENIWRFDVDGTAQTCGVVMADRNAWKRPVNGVVCVTDDGVPEMVAFEGQVPSPRAQFGELRLVNAINDIVPRGTFVGTDIYGYIEDGKPYMVVPVRKMYGFPAWRHAWAGAVVYGPDAQGELVTDAGSVPGPVAGESMADEVLEAVNHREGFMASRNAKTAYDLAETGFNPKHFLLERADGSGERLVTALTPRGSSETPTAILEVDASDVEVGGWPKAQLYRVNTANADGVVRMSYGEVAAHVEQRYGAALQLANNSLRLLEIAPTETDVVSVTVGSDQRVFARILVNQLDRSTCVERPDGTEVRCDASDSAPLPIQGLATLFSNEVTSTPEGSPLTATTVNVDSQLSELTDQELAELLRQVSAESSARLGSGS